MRSAPSQLGEAPVGGRWARSFHSVRCRSSQLPDHRCGRYAEKDAAMTFAPSQLGEALVGGYRAMGLANLWLPDLRAKIEANIAAVARGARTKVGVECFDVFLQERVPKP